VTRPWLWLPALAMCCAGIAAAGEYDFTIPEAQRKPYDLRARLEARAIYHRFDTDAAPYTLNYYDDAPGSGAMEGRGSLELGGSVRRGIAQASLLTHHEYRHGVREKEWTDNLYEGYVSLKPSARVTVDAGKRSVVWGTGYAWNPAAFLNRPKDPDDPALNLEGRTLLGLDLIKSFSSPGLSNIGLAALLLPVIQDWSNSELGADGDLYHALKLYLLWRDTDIDLIYFDGPDQPRGVGIDFARNLAPHIAVHGEAALRQDAVRRVLDRRGNMAELREDQWSYLLGVRFLTARDTTFIAEYYHNGGGYDRDALRDFFDYQASAIRQWKTTGDAAVIERVRQATRTYYQQRNLGRDYFYLRISSKEPLDILYFNPWVSATVNLRDWSFSLQPGMTWTPRPNLELNLRVGIPIGPAATEFGEKPDAFRPEAWVRYYF
jgi:hypothetical protein